MNTPPAAALSFRRLLPPAPLLALAITLAGCATTAQNNVAAPTFPTKAEQAEAVAAPRVPALAVAGSAREVWLLRSALNVAALSCQRSGDKAIGPRYNAMLKQHKDLFAQAYLAEETRYRQTHGARWQTVQDREATQLYNRYASHPQQARFCAEADEIASDALAVTTPDFARFAAAAVPRLEAPAFVPRPAPPAVARAVPKVTTVKAPARKPAKPKKA